MKIAFVLLSYADDAPSGIERSVAGLALGLRSLGHEPTVIHATSQSRVRSFRSLKLNAVSVDPPVSIDRFEKVIAASWPRITEELSAIFERESFDIICWVDALWGLASFGPPHGAARTVLMVHIIGDGDAARIQVALDYSPSMVIVPSVTIVSQARASGLLTDSWVVVPNPLLVVEPAASERHRLWRTAPIRIVSRLGPEKGILELINSTPESWSRKVEVVLAHADFEVAPNAQTSLRDQCELAASRTPNIEILPPLLWADVPRFLAGASIAIVPSLAETFGLVALEAMSVGTPVVALKIDNLPHLIGGAGLLVDTTEGHRGLWGAADRLLRSSELYEHCTAAASAASRDYHPAPVAASWLRAALAESPTNPYY